MHCPPMWFTVMESLLTLATILLLGPPSCLALPG